MGRDFPSLFYILTALNVISGDRAEKVQFVSDASLRDAVGISESVQICQKLNQICFIILLTFKSYIYTKIILEKIRYILTLVSSRLNAQLEQEGLVRTQ